jgi:hypothetical protein
MADLMIFLEGWERLLEAVGVSPSERQVPDQRRS